jgi:short-subunit dehydrogenase
LFVFLLVITGATDGIGRAYAEEVIFHHLIQLSLKSSSNEKLEICLYCFQFARQGLNVVLISRSLFKLQNVAREIGKSKFLSPLALSVSLPPFIYNETEKKVPLKQY